MEENVTINSLFHNIGVIAKVKDALAVATTRRLLHHLQELGLTTVVEEATALALAEPGVTKICALEEMAASIDLAIVVGGDGSLLGVARAVAAHDIPVLGVNRGGLGFLADIHPQKLKTEINRALVGGYQKETHFLLNARVLRDEQLLQSSLALNDVVVHAGGMSRMMLFHLAIDGVPVYSQRSDGVIIASPTGSTAYSLSAGGPIMHPELDAIVVVPMFPHTLTSRPIVVKGSSQISITVVQSNAPQPQVSCDSQVDFSLQPNDQVVVAKSHALKLLNSPEHNFYEACRSKLDWASRVGK